VAAAVITPRQQTCRQVDCQRRHKKTPGRARSARLDRKSSSAEVSLAPPPAGTSGHQAELAQQAQAVFDASVLDKFPVLRPA